MNGDRFVIVADGEVFRQTTATATGVRVRKLLVDGVNDITVRRELV